MRCAYDPERNLVIVTSYDGNVYAISVADGSPVCAFKTGAGIYASPVVEHGVTYVASLDKQIYAIDCATGKKIWSYQTHGRIFATPVLTPTSLFVGSNDGCLYELDKATGMLLSQFQSTEKIVNPIARDSATKRIYLPTNANDIICLTPEESGA